MRHRIVVMTVIAILTTVGLLAAPALSQQTRHETQSGEQSTAQSRVSPQSITPDQRAAATRTFLGLGAEPDRAAAQRGEPLFKQNCAFCHGPQGHGATGASLITADEVLGDDHGEHLVPFLKKGRPEKGMPAFATLPDEQLKDIAEFIHFQVEEVANRGTYHVLNILTGNAEQGHQYVAKHCVGCHAPNSFDHIASKFRTPDQLQKSWIWPSRNAASSITATVKLPNGSELQGRVTQISDFSITLMDAAEKVHTIERKPGVGVQMKDPLAPHQEIIQTLSNDDMHNVTAYLETLK
jgi:mono/diheme cytochrome c family protein